MQIEVVVISYKKGYLRVMRKEAYFSIIEGIGKNYFEVFGGGWGLVEGGCLRFGVRKKGDIFDFWGWWG